MPPSAQILRIAGNAAGTWRKDIGEGIALRWNVNRRPALAKLAEEKIRTGITDTDKHAIPRKSDMGGHAEKRASVP